MEKSNLAYFNVVYKVLEDWYFAFAKLTPKLAIGIIVFLFFLISSKYLSKLVVKILYKVLPKTQNIGSLLTLIKVFRSLIMLIGTFITLEIMGFSGFLWKFIGSLGVAGVIAGVALKDLASSIFSGTLIGIDKAFKVGDYIIIGNHSGTVQDIGFLTTKIITDDGKKAYIPNQIIFNAPFYNITAAPQRRLILNFDIPADEDIEKAKEGILDTINHLDEVDHDKMIDVLLIDLKQGIFTIQAKFWINSEANVHYAKSNSLLKIKQRLDKDKILLVTPTNINITKSTTINN